MLHYISEMRGERADMIRPFPVPIVMKMLYDIASDPEKAVLCDMVAGFAKCSRELFTLPPTELADLLENNSRIAAALQLLIEITHVHMTEGWEISKDFSDIEAAKRYFIHYFLLRPAEQVAAAPLSGRKELIGGAYVSGNGTSFSTQLPVRRIVRTCMVTDAQYVTIAHNHPGGPALPSAEDVLSTMNLAEVLDSFGIKLSDHIIVAGTQAYSMRLSGKHTNIFGEDPFYENSRKEMTYEERH